jgi:predicted Zn-dependent peptidase
MVAGRLVVAGERPRRRLFDVGLEWSHRRRYRPIAQSLADVDAITLDDVHRILAAWPLDAPAATVIAGPEG